jgi:hypothetical protein
VPLLRCVHTTNRHTAKCCIILLHLHTTSSLCRCQSHRYTAQPIAHSNQGAQRCNRSS